VSKLATTHSGEIQRAARPEATLAGLLKQLEPQMALALPKHLNGERMARLALTALRTTRDLASCTPESFAASIMACAALGLEPNTQLGLAYLIPRRNSRNGGKMECTMQIGYQGMLDLARRSGLTASIQAFPVFLGDEFRYSLGLEPTLYHVPCGEDDSAKLTHAYGVCRIKEADPVFVVLTRKQIEARRSRGGAGSGFSPWKTDYVPMAQKTAIRALFTWMPRSAEMARAEAIEVAQETGRSVIAELPEQAAAALLGVGIQDVTDDGEIVDGFGEEPAERTREPVED
jgi:recombination protein RecT